MNSPTSDQPLTAYNMTKGFLQATDQDDSRMPKELRPLVQPWKTWWPRQSRECGSLSQEDNGIEIDPWVPWKFDNNRRFEKPWLEWPLKWPRTYSEETFRHIPSVLDIRLTVLVTDNLVEAPMPCHDEEVIRETLATQETDQKLSEGARRTTSFLQFFAASSEHASEKPYVSKIPPPKQDQNQINFGGQYHQVVLSDIAGCENRFSLDVDGFEFHLGVFDYSEPTQLEGLVSDWLMSYLGCSEVFVFDVVTRRENHRELGLKTSSDVARRVHCDQTPRSAIGRIKLHMGERAETLLKGRCRLINVWRALVPLVEGFPLAVCSFATVSPDDLVPVDIVYPHYCEEAFEVLPSPNHKWYFRSGMTPTDIALLKIFDNKEDGSTAYLAPHSGFRDPRSHSKLPRSSIEFRCLVFGEPEATARL